jgi:vacuolar protein sorting-associated protein 35
VSAILKFIRQLTSILATTVDAPNIALRLFLLSAQIADECGFEDLTYDLYVQAFSVYEDSISESRAQLQAITLIIGTLAGAKVFGLDNHDTLITKAALHGAKLLKKSHQATAVGLASHLWWQEALPSSESEAEGGEKLVVEKAKPSTKDDGENNVKAVGDLCIYFCCCAKVWPHSILTRIASVFLSVCRNHFVSQIRRLKKL